MSQPLIFFVKAQVRSCDSSDYFSSAWRIKFKLFKVTFNLTFYYFFPVSSSEAAPPPTLCSHWSYHQFLNIVPLSNICCCWNALPQIPFVLSQNSEPASTRASLHHNVIIYVIVFSTRMWVPWGQRSLLSFCSLSTVKLWRQTYSRFSLSVGEINKPVKKYVYGIFF